MSKFIRNAFIAAAVLSVIPAMGACAAQEKAPDFGQQMRTQGLEKTELARSWEKGQNLENKGLKNIERGQDLLNDGEKKRQRAEKLMREAQDDMEDGRAKINKGNDQIAKGRRQMQEAVSSYQSGVRTGSLPQ